MMDIREQMYKAIEEMAERGDKLNVAAVARQCQLSRELICRRYPGLTQYINMQARRARFDAESHQQSGS